MRLSIVIFATFFLVSGGCLGEKTSAKQTGQPSCNSLEPPCSIDLSYYVDETHSKLSLFARFAILETQGVFNLSMVQAQPSSVIREIRADLAVLRLFSEAGRSYEAELQLGSPGQLTHISASVPAGRYLLFADPGTSIVRVPANGPTWSASPGNQTDTEEIRAEFGVDSSEWSLQTDGKFGWRRQTEIDAATVALRMFDNLESAPLAVGNLTWRNPNGAIVRYHDVSADDRADDLLLGRLMPIPGNYSVSFEGVVVRPASPALVVEFYQLQPTEAALQGYGFLPPAPPLIPLRVSMIAS